MPTITCFSCKAQNSESAKFCQKCGKPLQQAGHGPINRSQPLNRPTIGQQSKPIQPPLRTAVGPPPENRSNQQPPAAARRNANNAVQQDREKFIGVFQQLGNSISRIFSGSEPTRELNFIRNKSYNLSVQRGGVITLQLLDKYFGKGFNYYQVRLLNCIKGHESKVNQNGLCHICGNPLKLLLMHEYFPSQPLYDEQLITELSSLSLVTPGVLPQPYILVSGKSQLVLCDIPVQDLQNALLVFGNTKLSPKIAKSRVSEIGDVLDKLHDTGLIFCNNRLSEGDVLEPLVTVNNRIMIADIFSCQRFGQNFRRDPDVFYLARLFYTLISGERLLPSEQTIDYLDDKKVPKATKEVLKRALFTRTPFPDVSTFLYDLGCDVLTPGHHQRVTQKIGQQVLGQNKMPVQGDARSLRQMAGWRTDKGRVRDHNEDYVSKYSIAMDQTADTLEVGLYLVADGMGGHQAGEEASKAVTEVVIQQVHENLNALQSGARINRATINLDDLLTPPDILSSAIQKGNEVLLNARKAVGGDRGTTITAALVIGSKAYIANVGDSRTYLLHQNVLIQQTRDHSLVDSLVRGGVIKPEEVRSHPQRNQIYRTMGDRPNVEVDIFTCNLQAGDRLLLCSDGLWEMVQDKEIERIILQSSNPQAACDYLISEANRNGGEDNISAIVVFVE
jgi:serine/threonine protein phosphatase PrpC